MNKKKFFERYKDIFNTTTFSETYKVWKALSEEERKKLTSKALSEARFKFLDNHPNYVSSIMKGHKVSEETKKKISNSNKEYYKSEDNRKKTSESIKRAFKENPRDPNSYKKQSETLKKTYLSHPEIKENISKSVKQYYYDHPEHHKIISEKTSEAMKVFYATEKGQENLKKWTDGSRAKGTSNAEKEIQEFIGSKYNGIILFNDRTILNGKELDIYIPEKNLAIEYNGNIWHSEAFKKELAQKVHLQKTILCEQKNIRLIHIFSDEWEFKKEIIKSILCSAIGIYNKKYFARKLLFKEVPHNEAVEFFNINHIQGNTSFNVCYGLYDNNELIQAASFGENRFKKIKSTELIRMATKLNCQVLGGFSKIMKDSNIAECESYVDRRLFNANGYRSSGWKIIGESGPRYFYTDGTIRENRQKYMKQSCLKKWPECNNTMTEHEMCLMHGLYRIYDCGCLKAFYKRIK